jgi:hypothetical protein
MPAIFIDQSFLLAQKCNIVDCMSGIEATGKNCDIVVNSCSIFNSATYGLSVSMTCAGKIVLKACTLQGNAKRNIENDGLGKCKVIVNGNVLATNGVLAAKYSKSPSKFLEPENPSFFCHLTALSLQRAYKRAGAIDIGPQCGYCLEIEPSLWNKL